ncbi:STE3-domain-containing protein [Schizopora paradoxa]|uniref:STE3-domain-containing protein n=1 Tax=Schizopora paradoxa TaxID=27342 RepID=A0A0H2S4A3_9AGAM|nr:STE3-domain-containing protein [Schizopora paradoxa]
MQDPSYPFFPIAFFLSFILVLVPLPWHLQAWNVGTVMYIVWTALACLNQFINSIVWRNDAIVRIAPYCDISIRFVVASSVAIPAASLTISRRLYHISRVQAVMQSAKEKRREMIIDLSVCLGLPAFVTIIWYFVQGHRFDILEQVGCLPATFNTLPAYFLLWSWPLILGGISMVYCSMTLYHFLKRRREMNQFLSNNSMISFSRYFRLMALASMDAFLTVPLGTFAIIINVRQGVQPWAGLADAHWGFSRIDQVPALLWHLSQPTVISLYLNRVFVIVCALVFFSFFGFADECRKNYARLFWRVAGRFGFKPKERAPGSSLGSANSSFMRTPAMSGGSVPDFVDRSKSGSNRLTVMIGQDVRYEKKNRDSFMSIGDLSSSFTVDLEDQKPASSPTSDASSSYTMPDSPTDEKETIDEEMREQLSTLPRLTSASPVPPPPVIRVSLDQRRQSLQQQPERTATPSRPSTRPDTMDFDL